MAPSGQRWYLRSRVIGLLRLLSAASLSLPRTRGRDKKTREAVENVINLMVCGAEAALLTRTWELCYYVGPERDTDEWHEGRQRANHRCVFVCVLFFFFIPVLRSKSTHQVLLMLARGVHFRRQFFFSYAQ